MSQFKIKPGCSGLVSILISYVQRLHGMFASSQIYRYETDTKEFAQKCSLQLGKNENISNDGGWEPCFALPQERAAA